MKMWTPGDTDGTRNGTKSVPATGKTREEHNTFACLVLSSPVFVVTVCDGMEVYRLSGIAWW